jgi:eukaryotic-like serine/threonine-protein kinase
MGRYVPYTRLPSSLEQALPESAVGLKGILADRYEILREIGRGGMATVYLAHDLRHDSSVAVKVLHPELAAFIGQTRFAREIQVTAQLQHPNILPIFDSGYAGALHFYVTPYVEGESLDGRIAREGQLQIDNALDIACEVADALSHAHAHGLVHRDIKPANILLAHGHAMIADFGIAHMAGPGMEKLTDSGMALGTVTYMSPEQAAGGNVDGRSDVYSLGCVLYEMLAGHPPFIGANPQAVIARHMTDPAPPLCSIRPTVTPAIEKAIHKAMAKAPADRFATAGEFRNTLRRAETGAALAESTGHTAVERGRRATPMSRIMTTIAIAVVILVIIGALLAARIVGFRRDDAPPIATADPNRIAVLYFDDDSPDRSMGYLASGLTESLIRELGGVPVLHVVSQNGVKQMRDRAVPLDQMASVLGVGSIVQGSVQRSGDTARVSVDLVDATTGRHLASRSIDRPVADLFGLEDDVSQQVATLLRTRLGAEIRLRRLQEGTTSVSAREMLLRAEDARDQATIITTHQHAGDPQDALVFLHAADSLLVLAQTADPNWAQPPVARGWVMLDIASLSPIARQPQAFRLALENAAQALKLAPRNPYALELQGIALWRLAVAVPASTRDEAGVRLAEQDLRAAVSLQPGLASAWSTLSSLLRIDRGSLGEANVAARRALAADAYLEDAPAILSQLSLSELLLGNFPAAIEACDQGSRRFATDRRFVNCRLNLILVDTALDQNPRTAWRLVAQLDRMDPPASAIAAGRPYDPVFRRMAAAAISARAGDRDSARAVVAWAHRTVGSDANLNTDLDYDEAYVQLALGNRDATLQLLARYLAARPAMKPYIRRDPLFTTLRDDVRFTALLQTP